MDRNREARRATNMAAPPNGLSSSRRRHRSTSLRDSPDEDGGGVEVQEAGRLRERGIKKDRDRDRERERERSSRSKRRRENRMLIHHNQGSNRDDADDTSEESVNDEDEEDDDDAGNGGGLRMLPPPPSNPSTAMTSSTHHNQQQQLHHRKSFPPSANKVFRAAVAAAPPPAWKAADEMIGVSVPRKARSASTKRSHEWTSGVVGATGAEQVHRQSSTSPVRLASSAASPAPAAPPSPSSSNVSVRKKMKANGGGSKPRPPKSSSKSSSSNPEELEIEIAEVLYGLMTQSQAPSKKEDSNNKFDSNKSSSDNKSRVSSPISNSTAPPQNSLSTVAPKRKRPRQVSDNPFSVRSSPVSSSIKAEIDPHQHHQSPKTDISSPYLETNSPGSAVVAAENGVSFGFTSLAPSSEPPVPSPQLPVEEEVKCGGRVVLTKQEVEKESSVVRLNEGNGNIEAAVMTDASPTTTNLNTAKSEVESQKEEKFKIDLMAPPPQVRSSPDRDGEVDFSDHKQMGIQETSKSIKGKEDEKQRKSNKEEEEMDLAEEQKKLKAGGSLQETGESSKQSMNEDLHIDLAKPNKDSSSMLSGTNNRSLHQVLKHQQLSSKAARDETHTDKTVQPSSMPVPMSVANWRPMGYVAPGVLSLDGNNVPSAPIQPIFTHPRPKRCATHCYIARNIHYLQQFMKMNPFWPAASGSAPMYGAKPCNLNVMPSTELHGNIAGGPLHSVQDKAHGKENKSSQATSINIPDPAQRKQQQVLLQQALPPVAPNNILHGPPAFIFPFNQQQAVAASASVRPGSSKVTTSTTGGLGAASSAAANSATVSASTTAAAPALSFNYPNMTANETQYLAILQNNPYPFPIPAVGAPPNYRANPHAQPMPLFNGSFYSSQMIHPSQIPQQPPQQAQPTQTQQISQTHQNSSGSTSSSQKHLQVQQQRQQGTGVGAGAGAGSGNVHNNYPAAHKSRSSQQHMNPPPQARHLENEVAGGEDSPSTADSRVSRAATTMSVYGHNFAMPVHSQNFALMNPQAALSANANANANSNDKKQQQQGLKRGGAEPSLPPQTFAMSFAPMNGTSGTMAQNHAIFQSLPESLRQSYHHMMSSPASAHHAQQKKDFRISEETTRTGGHDSSSNVDEDRKASAGKSGQSIAFSRPDLTADASGSSAIPGSSVIDSSRNINLASNNRSSRSPISTSVATTQSSHHLHMQFQQQQQVLQLQKQQQNQNMAASLNARSKNPPSSNGSAYPEHLLTSSSAMAAKFPSSLNNSFPQNLVQTSSNPSSSPAQSPQWRNSVRGPTQVPSSATAASSLKNLHQSQQQSRPHQQSHNQISFGTSSQKPPSTTSSSQMQQQNQSSNNSNQCPSPPMLVGSPTTSSMSKGGGGGSPRTNPASASTSGRTAQASSLSSSHSQQQQAKNSPVPTQRSSPSILGNPHITSSTSNSTKPQQQQLPNKQMLQQQQQAQAHLFFTNPYMQQPTQAQQHSGTATGTSGYYLPRKQQQSSSTAMLSLCPPVTLANATTSDPAKAIAAATSNLKGQQQGGILQYQSSNAQQQQQLLPAGFPQYAAVQVKPSAEQKQPAGNDNLRTSWQPDKK